MEKLKDRKESFNHRSDFGAKRKYIGIYQQITSVYIRYKSDKIKER